LVVSVFREGFNPAMTEALVFVRRRILGICHRYDLVVLKKFARTLAGIWTDDGRAVMRYIAMPTSGADGG
jgi:hypothetical protein